MLDRKTTKSVRAELTLWASRVSDDFLPRLVRMLEVGDRRLMRGGWRDYANPWRGCLAEMIARHHPNFREAAEPGRAFIWETITQRREPWYRRTDPVPLIWYWDSGEVSNTLAATIFRAELERRQLAAAVAPKDVGSGSTPCEIESHCEPDGHAPPRARQFRIDTANILTPALRGMAATLFHRRSI